MPSHVELTIRFVYIATQQTFNEVQNSNYKNALENCRFAICHVLYLRTSADMIERRVFWRSVSVNGRKQWLEDRILSVWREEPEYQITPSKYLSHRKTQTRPCLTRTQGNRGRIIIYLSCPKDSPNEFFVDGFTNDRFSHPFIHALRIFSHYNSSSSLP